MSNEKNSIDLKPCPFCGSAATSHRYMSVGDVRYMTYCSSRASSSGCAGTSTASKATQYLADVHWNQRA